MDLVEQQESLHEWRLHNFPEAEALQQLLGVVEELGELAKVLLKRAQAIRPNLTSEDHEKDAIGDLMIYLMGYCSYREWSLMDIVNDTAYGVKQRNWRKYPVNGLTK